MKPDRKADENQQASMRAELHAVPEVLFGARPGELSKYALMQRQAKEMGRGFPSSSGGAMGAGVADPVGNLVVPDNCPEDCEAFPCEHSRPRADPAQQAEDFLTMVDEYRNMGVALVNRLHNLLGATPEEHEKLKARPTLISNCIVCALMALPRARRGMCPACYAAWLKAGQPDIERFKHDRTAEVPVTPSS